MKDIRSLEKKKMNLEEIIKFYNIDDYSNQHKLILKLIENNIIKPVKASETNGKSPALPMNYWILYEEEDKKAYEEELVYKLNTRLDNGYYLKNIKKYKEDRDYVRMLSEYFSKNPQLLNRKISLNERSFEIWGEEKFLIKGANRILKNLGLTKDDLNIYETTEPLAYYSASKNTPQTLLIIENKDTFYSMRKHLIEGNNKILGCEISTVIYGSGKSIYKTFNDFQYCVEEYLVSTENTILYLGDLDYEGIVIYEGFNESFQEKFKIKPFVEGYKCMIDKYLAYNKCLPITKDGQNKNIKEVFLAYFDKAYREKIESVLVERRYIPQEILNIGDF